MNDRFDPGVLSRIEDAGINASAPAEQLWMDGWLVRFSPGKAKRARCIQAVAAGRLDVEARLTRCMKVYANAALRPYVRITPFSQPWGLDEQLAALGMERIDDTRVMVAAMSDIRAVGAAPTVGINYQSADPDTFAEWVGGQRGSAVGERRAHASRLAQAPVPHRAFLAIDSTGASVAGGQVAVEGDLAGLYDVFTAEASRGLGIGQALCRHLLDIAAGQGAQWAYLQVDAGNETARRIYRRLGFDDAYAYHYRSPSAR